MRDGLPKISLPPNARDVATPGEIIAGAALLGRLT